MPDSESKVQQCSRREFLTYSGVAFVGASRAKHGTERFAATPAPGGEHSGPASDDLRTTFLNPPPSARPLTRWWWFGGAITPAEITRELEFMREAGIGGVELQPVYPLEVDDPERGIHNTRFFTADFSELLKHTVRETRRLGMQFDLTLGSGWPYGGPFVPIERSARWLRVLTKTVAGPAELSWDLSAQMQEQDNLVSAVATPVLTSGEPDLARSVVMTGKVRPLIENGEARGFGLAKAAVPPGLWEVRVFLDTPTLQQVKRPTLGMEGYVIDHHSREALGLFLEAAGDQVIEPLKKSVADPPIQSVFCDSLEVYGADWTTHFMSEFKRRRGYDFAPYLPALCQDAGPLTPHLRYDYHVTMSELIVENFFQQLAGWSKKHGLSSRIQAHGAFGDVMQGYAAADIPEGEDIFHGTHYSVNIAHRRLCTSAAHIYRKRLASAETYTWLNMPLLSATLEQMKAATDTMFLEGINHIVNSGYPSSPPQAGKPGWLFYAETIINHNNLWWPHYHYLAEYVQRVQSVMTQGVAVNPIAVYVPWADVFAKFGSGSLNMDEELERHLGLEPFLALRRAGYDFDLINDAALAEAARVEAGKLRAGDAVYSAVLVLGARWMPPGSLERLAEFAGAGGLLTFIGRLPEGAPGMTDQETRSDQIRHTLAAFGEGKAPRVGQTVQVGRGHVAFVADGASALSQLAPHLPPDFAILEANDGNQDAVRFARENVGFTHRRVGETEVYFVSNVSDKNLDLRARFGVGNRHPEIWDAETREIHEAVVFRPVELPDHTGGTELPLYLPPFGACFVVFAPGGDGPIVKETNWPGPLQLRRTGEQAEAAGWTAANGRYFLLGAEGRRHEFEVNDLPEPQTITGNWELEFDGGPTVRLHGLRSWNELAEARNYSGWATYRINFDMRDMGGELQWWLDLGTVHETAEASLNETPLGAAWKGARRLSCGSALRPGRNQLVARVGNLWVNNYYSRPKRDLKPVAETFGVRWGIYGEVPPKEFPPSGLLGPVRLVPLRRWKERWQA